MASKYNTQELLAQLKAAREAQGLSQRELSALAGLPQAHISKIENGAVDLRLSSFIELARVLELEPVLVPRRRLAAVEAVARRDPGAPPRPAYVLDVEDGDG